MEIDGFDRRSLVKVTNLVDDTARELGIDQADLVSYIRILEDNRLSRFNSVEEFKESLEKLHQFFSKAARHNISRRTVGCWG